MFGKQKIATIVAEFFGTGLLTLLVLSVQRSTIGVPFFVAIGAGLALAVTVYALHEASGAHFNPAITIALWTARKISSINAVLYIVVQVLGAWAAYYLFKYLFGQALQPFGGHFELRTVVSEGIGALIFAFGVVATVYKKYSPVTASAFTGISYAVGIIAASTASVGIINPAVAFGDRAWGWGEGWAYAVGPLVGAIVGTWLYLLFFAQKDAVVAATAVTAPVASAKAAVATKKPVAKKAPAKKPASKKAPAKKTTARRK